MKFFDRFGVAFCILGVCCVACAGYVICKPKIDRVKALKERRDAVRERIAAKRAEIDKLKEYGERFAKDPVFVEMIARRNRRVYPGEIVFIHED